MPNGKGMSMLPHELAQPGKEEHSAVVACSNKAMVMTEYSAIEEISYGSDLRFNLQESIVLFLDREEA